jgi:DNA-binding NarL/FixJ family response regulator
MQKISILLADEQHLIRLGLRQLLSNQEQFEIVGEACNEIQLMHLLSQIKVDIVIIDYSQKDSFQTNTVQLLKTKYPATRVMVMSSDTDKKDIFQILEMGIPSFVTKTCGTDEIVDAVSAVAKGNKFFCTRVIDFLLEKSFAKSETEVIFAPLPLSQREIEIVQYSAKGLIAKEIGGILNLSTHTVYTHKKNIMKKLGFSSSSELVLFAVNKGLVMLD